MVLVKCCANANFFCTVGAGGASLFGANHNKLGTALGTMGSFGATAFNTGTGSIGFGAAAQPVGEPSVFSSFRFWYQLMPPSVGEKHVVILGRGLV